MGFLDSPVEVDHAVAAREVEPDHQRSAEAHRVDLLYAGTLPSIFVSITVGITLALVQRERYSDGLLWSWVAVLASALTGRSLLLLAYRRSEAPGREPATWARRYCVGAWLTGAIWGATGWLFFPADSPQLQMFTLLALAGLSAGALTVLSVDSRGYAGYVALSLIPVAAHAFARGGGPDVALGILALLFMVFLMRAGRSISGAVVSSLELRYENRALVDRLSGEKARLGDRLTRLSNDLSSEILVFDAESLLCREANAGACRDLGFANEALHGMSLFEIHPGLDGNAFDQLAAPLRDGSVKQIAFQGQHRRKDGALYPVEARLHLARHETPPVFVVTALDVTEREAAEVRARERGAFVRSMLRSAPIVLWAVDQGGAITRVSGNLSLIRAGAPQIRVGASIDALRPGFPKLVVDMQKALEGTSVARDVIVGKRTLEVHHSPVKGEEGEVTGAIGVAVDVTERKMFEERLLKQANTDALTGLPNMAYARQRLRDALAAADRSRRKVAVLFLDLDNFKTVNDSLGHSAGDELLVGVARRLGTCVRQSDLISRMGGDEFLFLLEGLDDQRESEIVARKLNRCLDKPFSVKGQELIVTASVGIAVYPDDGGSPEALLQHADSALYGAKAAGRNTYRFFTHEMRSAAEARMAIESSLRRAMERDELTLHYQPLVRGHDRSIVGAEALLRWHSPELGQIPASTFISVAEDAGLISAMGVWVLEEACREAVRWQEDAGRPIRLCVNVSSRQFRDPEFLDRLREVLRATGFPPHLLDLEITERLLVEDAPSSLVLLNELAAMGVRLALDDFGTGYSSLSYLTRFPVHSIKIDRSFIRGVQAGGGATGLVDAIIALGHSLRLEVVAEGVETAEQLRYVCERGVDLVQGFHLHKPMPPEALRALLPSRARRGEALRLR